jgi:hypothetical protein
MPDSTSSASSDSAATIKDLEKRVRDLETSLKIGIAIAVLLGASGGWLGSLVMEARKSIGAVKEQAQSATADLSKAEAAGKQALDAHSATLVTRLDSRVTSAVADALHKKAASDSQAIVELSRRTNVLQHWLLLVFDKAAETGLPKHEGANGFWQKALIDSRGQAHAETLFKPLT